jgi:predicted DNA-binding protein (MmcQ/YjbR family)
MFCITGKQDDDAVSIKVTDEEFDELTERNGIIPAPYLARNKWICITKRNALKPEEWEHYIKQSYELVKAKLPKKIQKEIG